MTFPPNFIYSCLACVNLVPGKKNLSLFKFWAPSFSMGCVMGDCGLEPGRGETSLLIHVKHIHGKPTLQPRRQGGCCVCPSGAVLIKEPENQSFLAASSDQTGRPKPGPDILTSDALILEGLVARNENLGYQVQYRAPNEI